MGFGLRYMPSRFTAVMTIVVGVGMIALATGAGLLRANPGFALVWCGIIAAMIGANLYFLVTGKWLLGPRLAMEDEDLPGRTHRSADERLADLDRLKAAGRITQAEYDQERRRILDSI